MQRVSPHSILSDVGLRRGHDDIVLKGYLLAFLRVEEVSISILKGIDPIFSRCHALDDEASTGVGLRHSQQGFFLKDGI